MSTPEINTFILGPLENNTYLLNDPSTNQAVVIDPSFEIQILIQFCQDHHIVLSQAWLTHAHYDHFAGIFTIRKAFPNLHTFIHQNDIFLWEKGGPSSLWNLNIVMDFKPDLTAENSSILF